MNNFADSSAEHDTVLTAHGVVRRYGRTVALQGVDLNLAAGEILGLVGHNGAGKSTLMRVLAGREQPDEGTVFPAGGGSWDATAARHAGVRMIFQELALCPDLTVAESIALSDERTRGPGWRRRAETTALEVLDEIFPGHGISALTRTSQLPIAQRQMVEIARALSAPQVKILILDEPTESLSIDATRQLYAYLRTLTTQGVAMVLISHRMHEVLAQADRIAVMKDGRITEVANASETDEASLLRAMGGEVHADTAAVRTVIEDIDAEGSKSDYDTVEMARIQQDGLEPISVRNGEIVGLAGLAGHGQDRLLKKLWAGGRSVQVTKRRAYVPGDRQTSGIFPLWTVADNLTVSSLGSLSRLGVLAPSRLRNLASEWVSRLRIKGGARAQIASLSGGNQQKVIVARAFASNADLVLLDDPFRGVDVATKNDLYALMRAEATRGRSIIWYSTENSEMSQCDRVLVFRSGAIVSELSASEISEERIIADSFRESQSAAVASDPSNSQQYTQLAPLENKQ